MDTTVLSRVTIYSILGLSMLLPAFLAGNGQIQTFATSESGNTTETAGTTEITIKDVNGTEVLRSELGGNICWQTPEGGCLPDWPGFESLLSVIMNITMKDPTGSEIIRFENITVNCSPVEGALELRQCIQD